MSEQDDAKMRRSIYWLLVVVAGSILAGRIAMVSSQTGEVPFLSANDRSRWCTISALVDDGTFVIDRQISHRVGERKRRVWHTIDRVQHRGKDGKQHSYSSKPPLYPMMLAGVYAIFKSLTGAPIMDYPLMVGRWILMIVNFLPMLAYFGGMLTLIERYGKTNYGRILAAATLTCGTMLLPFATSINNHVPAAWCSGLALWCVLSIDKHHVKDWLCVVAGLAGGFAAACELPALSMTCLWGALLFWCVNLRAAIGYAVGVLAIAVAFFSTNYYAHGSLRPPYMHRGVGASIGEVTAAEAGQPTLALAAKVLAESGEVDAGEEALRLKPTSQAELLEVYYPEQDRRFALTKRDGTWRLYHWDDWYEYEGTYWQPSGRTGVDKGEQSRATYAFNATLGHHGIFSLTPIWLLSIFGAFMLALHGNPEAALDASVGGSSESAEGSVVSRLRNWDRARCVSLAIMLATLVCFAFYIARPLVDRNYGGKSSAFRWMLWFAPLWLWQMLPAVDRLASSKALRALGFGLLAIGVFAVITSIENPWQHPWIYQYWDYLGWIAH